MPPMQFRDSGKNSEKQEGKKWRKKFSEFLNINFTSDVLLPNNNGSFGDELILQKNSRVITTIVLPVFLLSIDFINHWLMQNWNFN